MSQQGAVLWDFDGTLGHRPAGAWGPCLLSLLDRDEPAHGLTKSTLSPQLQNRFPWHEHHLGHEQLSEPGAWWAHVDAVLVTALERAGLSRQRAEQIIPGFRSLYLEPTGWAAFPDVLPGLQLIQEAGWRNIIVSNHVPELSSIVTAVGLQPFVDAVLSSAQVGFEKPHPKIFEAALTAAGAPTVAWMVGDNPIADIAGAARLGLPGVLVRAADFSPGYVAKLNRSYAGRDWLNWQEACRFRADDALQAARLVLEHST